MRSFRPNPSLSAQLSRQPAFRADLLAHAERAKRRAEQIAPRGETGGYARRFTLQPLATSVRLGNTDIAAHLVEFGSANNQPYAPLRRAVRAAGLRLEEQ